MSQPGLFEEHEGLFSERLQEYGERVITVTGSRSITSEEALTRLPSCFGEWVERRYLWLLGGARGLDNWATRWLVERGVEVCIVVPFARDDQPEEVQDTLVGIEVVALNLPRSKRAFLKRNEVMIDHSSIVVGFVKGQSRGARQALSYALRKEREVHAYPIE